MKQHITVDQMNSITDELLAKALGYDLKTFQFIKQANAHKLFTIGKMIEIISEKYGYQLCDYDKYFVTLEDGFGRNLVESFKTENLCDGLWCATVYVLEEDQ